MNAQELPFKQIQDYPADFGPGNVMVRMVDALGFRYYWATQGLTQSDVAFKPVEEGRNVIETLQHICSMSETLLNAPNAAPNVRPDNVSELSFEELRKKTLTNLDKARALYVGKQAEDFESFKIVYQRGEKMADFSFWYMLNGMLSDCIYHTGQIVMMRRMNGNPINPKVNQFLGKVRQ